ncbi:hypothetical protein KA005_50335 [bacterium]|nr:hypothetical protein [bacterium]
MRKQEYISASKDSGNSDGTTASDYADALDWKCDLLTKKNILLKNTHVTSDLKYRVYTYAFEDSLPYAEVAETTLPAGDTAQIILNYAYAQVIVQVKDAISGSVAAYTIDYTGIKG